MSVIISNVGQPRHEENDFGGLHIYEVRINCKLITRFEHTRRDGLAVCLQKASEAVAKMSPQELAKLESSVHIKS